MCFDPCYFRSSLYSFHINTCTTGLCQAPCSHRREDKKMDEDDNVDFTFLDFAKVFDFANHRILSYKLQIDNLHSISND